VIGTLIPHWNRHGHQGTSSSTKGGTDLHDVDVRPRLHVGVDSLCDDESEIASGQLSSSMTGL
jgi:hypothetical protein